MYYFDDIHNSIQWYYVERLTQQHIAKSIYWFCHNLVSYKGVESMEYPIGFLQIKAGRLYHVISRPLLGTPALTHV